MHAFHERKAARTAALRRATAGALVVGGKRAARAARRAAQIEALIGERGKRELEAALAASRNAFLERHLVCPAPRAALSCWVGATRPSPRTSRTRRTPCPVLIGHAAPLTPY